ncbi:hypothetical protein CASFOL_026684 [Castilleja foliolosa]|uniref:FCP1 homology domain-containing protein n=1 Tax=Castilleja foliolosa TaxID=1961234 RepID=A0ABD3CLG4_9LAMI
MPRRRKSRPLVEKEVMAKNGPQIKDNTDGNMVVVQSVDQTKMDTEPAKNLAEVNVNVKRKRNRRRTKKTKIQSMEQTDKILNLNSFNGDHGSCINGRIFMAQESEVSLEKESFVPGLVKDNENPSDLCTKEEDALLPEVSVNGKRKRKKSRKGKKKNKDEIRSMEQTDEVLNLHLSDGDHGNGINVRISEFMAQESEVSLGKESSIPGLVKDNENPSDLSTKEEDALLPEVSVNVKRKRKKSRKGKKKNKDEIQSMEQTDAMLSLHLSDGDHGSGINVRISEFMAQESEVSLGKESSIPGLVKDNENPSDLCTKEEDALLPEVSVNVKRKRKKSRKGKKKNKDEIQSMEQTDAMLNLHLSDGDHGSGVNGRITEFVAQESEISLGKESYIPGLVKDKSEVSGKESSIPGLAKDNENPSDLCTKEEDALLPEVNVNVKRKRKKRKTEKTDNKDEIRSMEQTDEMLNMQLSGGDHGSGINGRITESMAKVSEVSFEKESSVPGLVKDNENPSDLCTKEEDAVLPDVAKVSCSSELVKERSGDFLRPMEVEEKLVTFEYLRSSDPGPDQMDTSPKFKNVLNEVNSEIVVDEGTSKLSNCDVELTAHVSCPDVEEAECLHKVSPQIAPTSSSKRKLIVLDVNGLLASIFFPGPKDYRGDAQILGRAVFKRPFCDDFLKFCFQNFDVGIWSSRSKRLIDRVVEYLLGDLQNKLLFCWDMDHSTQTGYKTLENYQKPLVCKELRKIWECDGPNLPWEKGYYNESNTLLLDDSPYKALLNPLHTAIFPQSYHHEDKSDNSLGPGGDLRVYLEGLLISDNVQKYVEQHPFGQSAINETSSTWEFYSGILKSLSIQPEDTTPSSLVTSS